MHLSKYIKIFPCKDNSEYHLLYSTKKASKILLHESTLQDIQQGDLSPEDQKTLTDLGFLVPDTKSEQEEFLRLVQEGDEKKDFNAIVVLNLDCNLACSYCFEGTMKGRHYMSLNTADLFMDFTKGYFAKGKSAHIDFYGGEPLLSFDMIKYISGKLKASAEKLDLQYTFGMITNGTLLTKSRVQELLPLNLRDAKVTLDGLKENHDRFRPFRKGSGSFDIIIRNIREVCEILTIQIGGNYTRKNFRDFPLLLDFLIDQGITPDKVDMIKFDPVTQASREFALPDFRDGAESTNEPWIIDASIYLREEILKRGFDTPRITPSRCAIEFKNDFIVNHDGTLYKCPAFIGQKDFQVGDVISGIKDYAKSYNLAIWKTDKCLECEYLPLCFGGCRFMKHLRDGHIDDIDCRKSYLDATLEKFLTQEITYTLKAGDN